MAEESNSVRINLGTSLNTCFVIMPFAGVFGTLYERVINPAVEATGLACIRADEVFSEPQITHEIWKQIRSCRIVIAELTGRNPNVLYELRLAHAIGKPVVIMTRNETDVPFDLKALRYLFFDVNDPSWGESLSNSLSEMCLNIVSQPNFGTVLNDIETPENMDFEVINKSSEIEVTTINLSGQWEGRSEFRDGSEESTTWVVHLSQSGELVSGTLISTFTQRGDLSVVNENLTGEISGDKLRLHGTGYSYLIRGASPSYNLDIFEGTVEPDHKTINGSISDENHDGPVAEITLNRQVF
jgi:hypothetical protein